MKQRIAEIAGLSVTVLSSALLAMPAHARAKDCDAVSVEAVQAGGMQYDPAAAVGIPVNLRLVTTSAAGGDCANIPVRIATQDGSPVSLDNGGSTLTMDLQQSSQTANLSFLGASLTGNARRDLFAGSVTVPLFVVRPGQFVPTGLYRERLTIAIGDAPPLPVEIVMQVQSSIRLVPQNGSSVKSISFGEVSQGSERTSSIYYVANGPFEVRLNSQNGGRLVHESGLSFGSIAYATRYDGTSVDLSGGPAIVRVRPSGQGVQIDELTITVPPANDHYAGKYRDVLSLDYIAF